LVLDARVEAVEREKAGAIERSAKAHQALEDAEAELERMELERDEAREWVRRMLRETQELRCAFCGEPYPPETSEHNDDRLRAHIEVCPKHPMRERDVAGRALAAALSRMLAPVPDGQSWSSFLVEREWQAREVLDTHAKPLHWIEEKKERRDG
jgi:hypothetical protein